MTSNFYPFGNHIEVSKDWESFKTEDLNQEMKVLLCSINYHFSDCLGLFSFTMALCVDKQGITSSILFNIYRCAWNNSLRSF